jgi:hypothetical protein
MGRDSLMGRTDVLTAEEYCACVVRRYGEYWIDEDKLKEYRKKKLDKKGKV